MSSIASATSQAMPITVLSGFIGAGKTTLYHQLLERLNDKTIAVVVEDKTELEAEADFLLAGMGFESSSTQANADDEGNVYRSSMSKLRDKVVELAQTGRFDGLLVEAHGASDPLLIAEQLSDQQGESLSLADIAVVDTTATVVDAVTFLTDYQAGTSLKAVDDSFDGDDERKVTDVLIEQVEFADVIVISKADLVDADSLGRLTAILEALNTGAQVIAANNGAADPSLLFATGSFDFARAQQAAGWLQEMRGKPVRTSVEHCLSSFKFEARRPLHPAKFAKVLQSIQSFGKLLRSKGYFWLATREQYAGQWSQAGGVARFGVGGVFWSAIPEENWPKDPTYLASIKDAWQEPFGDKRQELVFIGQNLDQEGLLEALESCLLSADETERGIEYWGELEEPFPPWHIPHSHD